MARGRIWTDSYRTRLADEQRSRPATDGGGPGSPGLPHAEAPTVSLTDVANLDEHSTVELTATLDGGTYDELDYAWSVIGVGTLTGSGNSRVYTPPNIAADQTITVQVTITAHGTGTKARSGTRQTVTATDQFTVSYVAPVPGAISGFAVTDAGDDPHTPTNYSNVNISWTSPTSPEFTIQVQNQNPAFSKIIWNDTHYLTANTATPYRSSAAYEKGTLYRFRARVQAVGSHPAGPWTAIKSVTPS